jgi:hypothetical protein
MFYNTFLPFYEVKYWIVIYWPSREIDPGNLRCSFLTVELSWGAGGTGDRKKLYDNTKCNSDATYAVQKFTTLPSYSGTWQHKVAIAVDMHRNFQRYTVEIPTRFTSVILSKIPRSICEYLITAAWYRRSICDVTQLKVQQTQLGLTANLARSTATSVGWNSSVGVANRYVVDGPGIATRWRRYLPQPFQKIVGLTKSSV